MAIVLRDGIPLSRVALGTMSFGDQADDVRAGLMLDAAEEAGVTLLDTANSYSAGASEEVLGRLLPSFGGRFLVMTKAGGSPSPDFAGPPLSRAAVRASVEGSLRRLGLEQLDLFLLHHPDPATPIRETVDEVAALVDEGKIRAYGASNFAAWRYAEFLWTARSAGLPLPMFAELPYNLVSRRLDDEYAEYAHRERLATIVFNPLAGGLLTGKYTAGRRPEAGHRFVSEERGSMYRDRYWKDGVFTALDHLTAIASRGGITLLELSLRWLLTRPVVDAVLLGASDPTQLRANLEAIGHGPLDAAVAEECDAVWMTLRGDAPPYGR